MKSMKKNIGWFVLMSCGFFASQAMAVTASSVATWQASAVKTTEADLVVTPLGSLSFQYAAGTNSFNSADGLFDIVVRGDHEAATSFKLSAQKLNGQLRHLSTDETLDVAVYWNGQKLNADTSIDMIDTSAGKMGGNLSNIAANYNVNTAVGDVYAQDFFTFELENPANGLGELDDMKNLSDGVFSGSVSIQFDAVWS
ncbi:common pilus major fimbrillin subunit EcpA [Aeromonas sp. A5]|uniref:common pilus major fimbrillin subunit EcpA n=1 Tax=unclassified Aeromonas TaxID=257493 RepID=UPI00377066BB